jgi:hypothetical protein
MNPSKFFLAATSGLLAMVGVVASRAHHAFNQSTTGFYKGCGSHNCNTSSSVAGFIQTAGNASSAAVKTCPVACAGMCYTVYSQPHIGNCSGHPLRTAPNQN